ncbi:MAG: hypothetical protein BRC25_00725 [Parcubacteria group bacterium SW_6_46_9]|nr:MAG: hypothetical protein BRC25_00725 [Parcubacteria group bacterium SW_6_46_9]
MPETTASPARPEPSELAEKLFKFSRENENNKNQLRVNWKESSVKARHIDSEAGSVDEVNVSTAMRSLSLRKKVKTVTDLLWVFLYRPVSIPSIYFSARTPSGRNASKLFHKFYLTVSFQDNHPSRILVRWYEKKLSPHPLHHVDHVNDGILLEIIGDHDQADWMEQFNQEFRNLGEIVGGTDSYRIKPKTS